MTWDTDSAHPDRGRPAKRRRRSGRRGFEAVVEAETRLHDVQATDVGFGRSSAISRPCGDPAGRRHATQPSGDRRGTGPAATVPRRDRAVSRRACEGSRSRRRLPVILYRGPMTVTSIRDLPLPEAVLFDLDGTLVDTVETRIDAWHDLRRGRPADHPGRARPLIGVDGKRLAREVPREPADRSTTGAPRSSTNARGEIYEELNRSLARCPASAVSSTRSTLAD